MRGAATLALNNTRTEYSFSAINNGGESVKSLDYLLEFEAKFEKPSDIK